MFFFFTVPEGVGEIDVTVMKGKINISWGPTPEPNDFFWKYTVYLTNSKTGDTILHRVLSMNITKLYDVPDQQLGIYLHTCIYFQKNVPV